MARSGCRLSTTTGTPARRTTGRTVDEEGLTDPAGEFAEAEFQQVGATFRGIEAEGKFRLSERHGRLDLTLRGGLGWRHTFGNVDPKTTLAFAGSNPFAIAGLPIARDAALVEARLDLGLATGVTLGASYAGQLAQDAQDHAFKGVLAVRF